jgi:hypothetical protein
VVVAVSDLLELGALVALESAFDAYNLAFEEEFHAQEILNLDGDALGFFFSFGW